MAEKPEGQVGGDQKPVAKALLPYQRLMDKFRDRFLQDVVPVKDLVLRWQNNELVPENICYQIYPKNVAPAAARAILFSFFWEHGTQQTLEKAFCQIMVKAGSENGWYRSAQLGRDMLKELDLQRKGEDDDRRKLEDYGDEETSKVIQALLPHQRLMHKYRDRLLNVVPAKELVWRWKNYLLVPENIYHQINLENVSPAAARTILFSFFWEHGTQKILEKAFCQIMVEEGQKGYPKAAQLGRDMLEELDLQHKGEDDDRRKLEDYGDEETSKVIQALLPHQRLMHKYRDRLLTEVPAKELVLRWKNYQLVPKNICHQINQENVAPTTASDILFSFFWEHGTQQTLETFCQIIEEGQKGYPKAAQLGRDMLEELGQLVPHH